MKMALPLLLQLAFDEAKSWHSFTDISNLDLGRSTREAVANLYKRLEAKHNPTFVSRAIGYIVASRYGLRRIFASVCRDLFLSAISCGIHFILFTSIIKQIPKLITLNVNKISKLCQKQYVEDVC